jgi:hypothetical protein
VSPPLKPYKLYDLFKILKGHDKRFRILERRGKGSHRMLYHPNINGRKESFPLICHKENTEFDKNVIADLIRRFDLPDGLL